MKVNEACDESGLAAKLLQHVPDEFLVESFLPNGILGHGSAPASWKKTLFTMLPKKTGTKLVTDFGPIANIRFLYTVFAYMILARAEESLENFQPEAQHGFRTCVDNKFDFGQEQPNWIAIVGHQFGFLESLRYSKLGNTVGSLGSTKYFGPIDLDFAVLLLKSNRCRSRWCW